MTQPLRDKAAIVTGASRGIGRVIALTLAQAGARVALAARSETDLEAVQAEIEAAGGTAATFPTDMQQEEDIVRLVQGAVSQFGHLDILVNNAGIGIYGPLVNSRTEDWDRMMSINARGIYIACREAIPHLRQSPPTFIVNISSVVGIKGYVNQAAYAASKHAVMGLTSSLAKEVHADGIRVHVICPGGVDTPMVGDARPDLDRSVLMAPEDIADVVLFLVTRRGNAVIDQINMRRAASTPFA
jgi:3-oxoacyl-[acyl-carrier protein] reductase